MVIVLDRKEGYKKYMEARKMVNQYFKNLSEREQDEYFDIWEKELSKLDKRFMEIREKHTDNLGHFINIEQFFDEIAREISKVAEVKEYYAWFKEIWGKNASGWTIAYYLVYYKGHPFLFTVSPNLIVSREL